MGLSDVNVFPVPAKELLTVTFNNTSNENIDVVMIDQMGRTISNTTVYNKGFNTTEINLNNVSNGVYILKFISNDKSASRKVIVSK
jgi:hypothetical protein